jgi:hypothetical protein
MLKSFSHIILSFLLLTATTGMAVSKHFCDEFLISTSFFAESEACCDDGNCCHNETTFYQVDEDFSAPQTVNTPNLKEIVVLGFTILVFNQTPVVKHFKTFHNNNSPPPLKVSEFLSLRQVFLL